MRSDDKSGCVITESWGYALRTSLFQYGFWAGSEADKKKCEQRQDRTSKPYPLSPEMSTSLAWNQAAATY